MANRVQRERPILDPALAEIHTLLISDSPRAAEAAWWREWREEHRLLDLDIRDRDRNERYQRLIAE